MSFYRPLVKLLVGMADISLNSTTSPKKMHALCLAVEEIHYTGNLTLIGPFSFSTSLVKWLLHGSNSLHALYIRTLLLIYRRYMNCPLDTGTIPKKISLHLYISLSNN